MKKLAIVAALALVSACSDPGGEDTADMAPDATTADLSPDDNPAGDGGAPELANVQAAIDRECPTLRARVGNAMCAADGVSGDFTCSYAFAQDPQGTERELTLTPNGPAWALGGEEPEFCGSLDRANLQADMDAAPADVSVDTQPTE